MARAVPEEAEASRTKIAARLAALAVVATGVVTTDPAGSDESAGGGGMWCRDTTTSHITKTILTLF